ncbi:hypothetical protein Moror_17832 [Moniliophthora roreri MCA 2997]|uniref:Uncharacterized protein n=1 Tax=Moniliophthora roreri (strain MCA 2997) TaxID=1381753 RepID=V2XU24_MONRO|nr:hypothetical protein Moror_17832 [Moniliophthora roreri MCA 2997]
MAYVEHGATASAVRIDFKRRPSFSICGVSGSKKQAPILLPLKESKDDMNISYCSSTSSASSDAALLPKIDESPSPTSRIAVHTLVHSGSVPSTASGSSSQIISRGKRAFHRTVGWIKDISEYSPVGSPISPTPSPVTETTPLVTGRPRRNSSSRKVRDLFVPPWKKPAPAPSANSQCSPLTPIPESIAAVTETSRPSVSSIASEATVMPLQRPLRRRCDSSASQLSTMSMVSDTSSTSQSTMNQGEYIRDDELASYDLDPPPPFTSFFHKGLRNRGSTIHLTPFVRERRASDASDSYFPCDYPPPFASFCLKDDSGTNIEDCDWNGEWNSHDMIDVQQKLRLLRSL